MNLTTALEGFRAFIASLGFEPPARIEPGCFARFSTNGRRGDDAGWALLFADCEGGVVGDFRTTERWTWRADKDRSLTADQESAWREQCERARQRADAERDREHRCAAERARSIWDGAEPAPEDHLYLVRKGVKAYGLRLHRGPLAISGMRCDRALLVPVRNALQGLLTLEFISADGEKRFLPRGLKAGGWHMIGVPGDTVCVAEGYATGASVHEATGHAVAVAFDKDNLRPVAEALHRQFPDKRFVVCADNDLAESRANVGVEKARQAAQAIGGLVAIPHLDGAKCDFNDVFQRKGREAVKQSIESAKVVGEVDHTSGIVSRRLSEVQSKPISWLWQGRIARGKVTMIAGNPGLGKSQITASIAAIVSTGGQWPVDRTQCERGSVVMLSAEDDAADTIRPRLEASGADLSRIHVIDAVRYDAEGGEGKLRALNLEKDVSRLGALLHRLSDVAVLIVDPVTAYLGATDSHKTSDVRGLLAELTAVASQYNVAVVVVSHLNKSGRSDAMMRVTGSLAFVAAARAAYLVAKDEATEGRRLLLPIKNNIGDDKIGLAFTIESVLLPSGAQTSRIAWESSPVTITADQALESGPSHEERSAMEEAKDWLSDTLANGPVSVNRLLAHAQEAGLAERTIRRAKKALAIIVEKDGMHGGWTWKLPPKMAEVPEDALSEKLDTFADLGNLQNLSSGDHVAM